MFSIQRRALISPLILVSIALAVSGCVSARLIDPKPRAAIPAAKAPCSGLIADSLRQDVPGVEMPAEDASAGDLWKGLDGQTGQLDTANLFKRVAIDTVEMCELRDRAVREYLQAPFWKRWFMRPPL